MLHKEWHKRVDKDTAIMIWANRLSAVDALVERMQKQKTQDAWALKYWQDVRRTLTRQLDNICQTDLNRLY